MHLSLNHRQATSLHRLLSAYFGRSGASKGEIKYCQDDSTVKWKDGEPNMTIEFDIPDKLKP